MNRFKQHILKNYLLVDTVRAKCIKKIYHTVLNFKLHLYYSYLGMHMRILLFMVNNIVFIIDIKHFNITLI